LGYQKNHSFSQQKLEFNILLMITMIVFVHSIIFPKKKEFFEMNCFWNCRQALPSFSFLILFWILMESYHSRNTRFVAYATNMRNISKKLNGNHNKSSMCRSAENITDFYGTAITDSYGIDPIFR
jgi:hypothetical protein